MDNKTGNAKGSIFINIKEYVTNSHGEDEWNKILNNLPDSDSEILKNDIIRTEWYPTPLLNRLINTYDVLIGNGDFSSIIPIAEHIAKKDLGPLFEVFVNLDNPYIVLNNTPALWSRYFDSGQVELDILDLDKKYSTLYLYEAADENRASGVAICNVAVPKWFKVGLLMAGAKSANITQTDCRYKGAQFCKFEVRWE